MNTQLKNGGFIGLLVLIVIGAVAALYFLKNEQGVRYIHTFTKRKDQVMKEVDAYKGIMEARDKQIEKNLQ